MSLKFTMFLWLIALSLGLSIFLLQNRTDQGPQLTDLTNGSLLLPDLSPRSLTAITLQGAKEQTHLVRKNSLWRVQEREDFPANIALLRDLTTQLLQAKALQGFQAGLSYNARFGMDKTSSTPSEHGLIITLHQGERQMTLHLGKESALTELSTQTPSSQNPAPQAKGRFVRLQTDPQAIYLTANTLSALSANPADWLEPQFIQVDRIQSIALTAPNDPSFIPWTLSRTHESGDHSDFLLTESPKKADPHSLSPFKTLLAQPTFSDVLTPQEARDQKADPIQERQAVIQTFDGFTYTLTLQPLPPQFSEESQSSPSHSSTPSPSEKDFVLLSYQVQLDLPPITLGEQASDEEKSLAQEAQETLKKRFVREQHLEGRLFKMPRWALQDLLKNRSDFFPTESTPSPPQ